MTQARKNGRAALNIARACWAVATIAAAQAAGAWADTLTLSIGKKTVTFASASPAMTSSIPAAENPINLSVTYTGTGSWAVTVLALGDLQSGSDSISISKVHWTATGAGYSSGTLSAVVPQSLGVGLFTPSPASGTISFFMDNSWTYPTGIYTQSIVITAVSL